jgi:uncharacterized protein (TIGR02996 family)
MTDGERLLRAIRERPEEDTPRLAYADWLDENAGEKDCESCVGKCGHIVPRLATHRTPANAMRRGDFLADKSRTYSAHWEKCSACTGTGRVSSGNAARAEFVRVQVELAASFGLNERRRDELARLERELLERHGHDWCSTPAGLAGVRVLNLCGRDAATADNWLGITFRRGFVAEVRLSAAAFLGGPCRSCYIEVGGRRIGCRVCSDTGRTPGLAGPLFAAHPITAVRLTDLEPFEWTPDAGSSSFDQPPQYSWINEEKQRGMGDERRRRAMVPALLWPEVVKRPKRVRHDEYARFFTRQAARDALSAAAVAFGRAAANLTAQPAVTG